MNELFKTLRDKFPFSECPSLLMGNKILIVLPNHQCMSIHAIIKPFKTWFLMAGHALQNT